MSCACQRTFVFRLGRQREGEKTERVVQKSLPIEKSGGRKRPNAWGVWHKTEKCQ